MDEWNRTSAKSTNEQLRWAMWELKEWVVFCLILVRCWVRKAREKGAALGIPLHEGSPTIWEKEQVTSVSRDPSIPREKENCAEWRQSIRSLEPKRSRKRSRKTENYGKTEPVNEIHLNEVSATDEQNKRIWLDTRGHPNKDFRNME